LLHQRKRRLVLSDSVGDDTTQTEQDINLAALHTLARTFLGGNSSDKPAGHDVAELPADTSMPFRTTRRRLRKPSVDAAVRATAPSSSSIPTAADKGKAPMVDDFPPADLLLEQERVLKNLYDSQLGEELAKKIQAEQEAEFARQQEECSSFRPKPNVDALSAKRAKTGVPHVPAASSPILATPEVPADVSVSAATTPAVPADVSVSAASTQVAPADIFILAASTAHA
nr:hypothetical protein [Tanacetum cinerariifolium]